MEQIEVRILDREYRLAVSAEEKERLLAAVKVVDEKMRAVREAGRVSGIDRIAVMAALQLAHQLLSDRETEATRPSAKVLQRIRRMTEDLDAEIKRQESLF